MLATANRILDRAGRPLVAGRRVVVASLSERSSPVLSGYTVCVPRAWATQPQTVVEAAVAHEAGHAVAMSSMPAVLGAVALRYLRHLAVASAVTGIVLNLATAWSTAGRSLTIVGAGLAWGQAFVARRAEYAADRFAVRLVGADAVNELLEFLARKPRPAAFGLDTHPSPAARVRAIEKGSKR